MHFEKRIPVFIELGFSKNSIPQLKEYIDLLWDANTQLNLISRKMTMEELIDNHVIDCLLPLKLFPADAERIADFGAGGGLPGIIYALQFPQKKFRLYEKSKLKQQFLNHCKQIAPNIEVEGEIPIILKNIDLVISRAFKPIDVVLDVSRNYYKSGGKYFLLNARKEKIDEAIASGKKQFKDLDPKIIPLKSPVLDVERHLVLIP